MAISHSVASPLCINLPTVITPTARCLCSYTGADLVVFQSETDPCHVRIFTAACQERPPPTFPSSSYMPTVIAPGSSVCRSQKPLSDDVALALYDDPDFSPESFVGFCASSSPNPDSRLSSSSSRFRPNRPSAGYSTQTQEDTCLFIHSTPPHQASRAP
ncbi:hypothetical protein ASPBRDRAFT_290952 [Aspergillus brasiliensis CBS 101740]|uniref:Uncharacterized protein n=1 Tax=Aspergillus brasiliensis (strain CBS 101740 / IMI 381727 / IBT 21946) TaxID=767769 RepID=A0A1L9UBS8_ASPBC|nr:hypothetical protein ASPBRDRAFT_290952 [Aspergillus brasiliensis CBS 101740]